MEITRGGETHVFDSFECAINAIAPVCDHCACKPVASLAVFQLLDTMIGHGIESNGSMYCCAHCAAESGVRGARDRVEG
jgi:hypothetical protein